jgi:hypothetical protein
LYVLALLTLCGVNAYAQEVPAAAPAEIQGRVFELGSLVVVPDASITAASGESVFSDGEGRFSLRLPAGDVQLVVTAPQHEPLKVVEHLVPGQGLRVDYRLVRKPHSGQRYESTVRGEARHEGERFSLRDEELHQLAGTLGDPYHTIGLMPGVGTPLTLLPVYIVRGASPGSTGFFLDGMRVPGLYHVLLLGGVVHPRLVDRLDFYPGAYDVSFGRFSGGIIDSETRPARADAPAHAEVELRLFDLSALAEVKLPSGARLEVAGTYGFPSYLINLFTSGVDVNYWDFQLRFDWKGLTIELLGSYDFLSLLLPTEGPSTGSNASASDVSENRTDFYRLQIRDREKIGRLQTEAALVAGIDDLETFGASVTKYFVNARGNLRARWPRFTLYTGADLELSRFIPHNFSPGTGGDQPDQLGDLGTARDGVVAGAFAQGTLEIVRRRLWATAGVRADVYHAEAVTLLGVDPRLQLRAKLLPWLSIEAGIGLYQQPPSFPIALPGIDTFALQLGLQRAIQGAYSVEAELPQASLFRLTGYWEQFYNINDAVLDFAIAVCTSPPPESLTGFPARITRQVDGHSYGMELLARKKAGRFTGWVAYTLSRSERLYSCGLRPADYDQTHILNVVGQVRLPWNLMASARFLVQTGRPVTILQPPDGRTTVRNNARLGDYVQLDVRVDREWLFRRWALSVFVDLVNVTYSETALGITYPTNTVTMTTDYYAKPQVEGFHWILPSVGLRGRF